MCRVGGLCGVFVFIVLTPLSEPIMSTSPTSGFDSWTGGMIVCWTYIPISGLLSAKPLAP
ncbi:hypothetical protein PF011_g13516 [Phytophthora fragariae]|uniref:Uncharacterized protein n=1 Tax=Phytophthora fragariae TaxID=53985 RepID=A0A6A3K8Q5_9STRA|nr:hypothetical protein PF011_g13516 [Phytophthora fragariae]